MPSAGSSDSSNVIFVALSLRDSAWALIAEVIAEASGAALTSVLNAGREGAAAGAAPAFGGVPPGSFALFGTIASTGATGLTTRDVGASGVARSSGASSVPRAGAAATSPAGIATSTRSSMHGWHWTSLLSRHSGLASASRAEGAPSDVCETGVTGAAAATDDRAGDDGSVAAAEDGCAVVGDDGSVAAAEDGCAVVGDDGSVAAAEDGCAVVGGDWMVDGWLAGVARDGDDTVNGCAGGCSPMVKLSRICCRSCLYSTSVTSPTSNSSVSSAKRSFGER
eukprot:CAMPEP_0115889168 /NCGR_PEP_ID=MMETSP0287-20121206/32687_1 /TAXON_ID=412157 /ORGANISM="Chrysochromulina rotalis, Strain UIO044" /LENGTH=279 /DNA_ID=CAMNT_0003345881 /DNA_START=245 /DNA_END=1081 /DNA_ORIENTATION=+